jgi:hypothetical protein
MYHEVGCSDSADTSGYVIKHAIFTASGVKVALFDTLPVKASVRSQRIS